MKIACPKCATTEMGTTKKADFACINGHIFAAEDGLLHFSDVIVLGKAAAHPTRLRILVEFGRKSELSASELTRILDLDSVATVRYHVRSLVDLGFLERGRDADNHGATEHKYELVRGRFASS